MSQEQVKTGVIPQIPRPQWEFFGQLFDVQDTDTLEQLFSQTRTNRQAGLVAVAGVLQTPAGLVYYPGSGTDDSPSISGAFGNSRIIYTDIDVNAIAALQKAGYEACVASSDSFDREPVDVLLMFSPEFDPVETLRFVKAGGHVVCNDWLGTASRLQLLEEYELVGAVIKDQDGQISLDTLHLSDYLTPLSGDEEFRGKYPQRYTFAERSVNRNEGGDDIYSEYVRLWHDSEAAGTPGFDPKGIILGLRPPYRKLSDLDMYIFHRTESGITSSSE